jgi:hypothetical protein
MQELSPFEILIRLNAVSAMKDEVSDEIASRFPNLYPKMNGDGKTIKAGTRINCNGRLKRALKDVRDSEKNSPEHSPASWEEIPYKNGKRTDKAK